MTSVVALQSLSSNSQAVWAALLWGLTTSVHCLGMCGGFALSAKAGEIARSRGRAKASAVYHAGRFLTYTSAGIICGWLGQRLAERSCYFADCGEAGSFPVYANSGFPGQSF